MSINVDFYSFNKKLNSTKIPGAAANTFSCTLKDDCSIINPIIRLAGANASFKPVDYNYARIADFGRYYFITDWKFSQGCWQGLLTVDSLASWRYSIGESYQYITRCADNEEGDYVDNKYPAFSDVEQTTTSAASGEFQKTFPSGTFVIGVWGGTETSQVGPTYYSMTLTALQEFLHKLFSTDIFTDILTGGWNPLQYLTTLMWFPLNTSEFTGTSRGGITVATKNILFSGTTVAKELTAFSITKQLEYNLPKHPQAQERGYYLTAEPYTNRYFSWESVGNIPLDCSVIYGATSLSARFRIDVVTGSCNIRFTCNGKHVTLANFRIGCEIPIAANTASLLGMTQDAVTAVSGLATANLGLAVSSAIHIPSNMFSNFRIQGSASGIAMFMNTAPVIVSNFRTFGVRKREIFGAPYCHYDKISTHVGFLMCENPVVEIDATSVEIAEILKYMGDGFYYE